MTRWEYEVVTARWGESLREELDTAGREGWELVSVILYESGEREAYLKRPLAQEDTKP